MKKTNKKYLIVGVVILVITIPLFFYLVEGHIAEKFFKEQSLGIATTELDVLIINERFFLAYAKSDTLILREQRITGEVLNETILNYQVMSLQLFENNSKANCVFESNGKIFLLENFGQNCSCNYLYDGFRPNVFKNNDEFYLCFMKNNVLYCHRFLQSSSLLIIDNFVYDYTVTSSETNAYISYLQNGIIKYSIVRGNLWEQPKTFQKGVNPIIVPSETELLYLYYFTNISLNVGFGLGSLTHTKALLSGTITEIKAYENIVIFVKEDTIYLQEITNEGLSTFYPIILGQDPHLCLFNDNELIMIVYRDGLNYHSLVIREEDKTYYDFYPIKLDALIVADTYTYQDDFESWYKSFNDYYYLKWDSDWWHEGEMREWLIEHPFWLTAILFTVMAGLLAGGYFLVRALIIKMKEKRAGVLA